MSGVLNLRDIKKIVSQYGPQFGSELIFLFVAYARGEAIKNSDIDLRIDKDSIVAHAFDKLDSEVVWEIITEDISQLEQYCIIYGFINYLH